MSEKEKQRELIIIGAGPGGYAAAFRAADLGLKVTLIDPETNPGGVCLYRGCIPSKSLLHLVKIKQEAAEASSMGLKFEDPEIDLEKINTWKDSVIEKLTAGLGKLSEGKNIEYIKGTASLKSEDDLEVKPEDGDPYKLSFKNLILATGSQNLNLPDIEVDHKRIMDSADALRLEDIPESLLVVGGGYIGLEMGSVYAVLGSKVSVAEMTPGFLPGADRDLVAVFENEHPFEELYFNTKLESLSSGDEKITVQLKQENEDPDEIKFDKVLIAVGRKPNTESLNLENAGINTDDKGFIEVDALRKTSVAHIFAIGDLTGEPMLAHKATHEGRVAAEVIAGKSGAAWDPKSIPGIVFTNPEIAWCGLTETEADEKGIDIRVLKFPWSASGRAAAIGTSNGLTKLIIDPDSKRILGGGVAGKNAGSLIPQISFAIEMAATAEDLALSIHPHPTLSETIMEAAEIAVGSPTHLADSGS